MPSFTLHVIVYCFFSIGSSNSDLVTQTGAIYSNLGDEAAINCYHTHQSYNQILWYKQLKDRQLEFLGYMNVNYGFPEEKKNVKIQGSATTGQTCTLKLDILHLNSSAVYLCAASFHSAAYHSLSVQKPPYQTLSSSQLLRPVFCSFVRWQYISSFLLNKLCLLVADLML